VGGKGGGKPDMAMAGGTDATPRAAGAVWRHRLLQGGRAGA
jgi:alanyl-tRNA synthetase